MKPIDFYTGDNTCKYCGGCVSQSGIPVFGCNHKESKDDGLAYTNKCTLEDWKTCGLNREVIKHA